MTKYKLVLNLFENWTTISSILAPENPFKTVQNTPFSKNSIFMIAIKLKMSNQAFSVQGIWYCF